MLRELGLFIEHVQGDGNCGHRALADRMWFEYNEAAAVGKKGVMERRLIKFVDLVNGLIEQFIQDSKPDLAEAWRHNLADAKAAIVAGEAAEYEVVVPSR